MGAKGSKPINQTPGDTLQSPRANVRNNTRNNTRKNNQSTRRNNTRGNKQPPAMPPTFISKGATINCAAYPPPDPEEKVPRRNVPHKCLVQWELDMFSKEAMARSQARAASKVITIATAFRCAFPHRNRGGAS